MLLKGLGPVLLLLMASNTFMLSAWYLHLRLWGDRPWYIAAFLSWCIAGVEYSAHIPANRLGNAVLTLPQLQILQVGLSLLFFIPFAVFVMKRPLGANYLLAAACLVGAAFFIFREARVKTEIPKMVGSESAPSMLVELQASGPKAEH